jgi:transcription-repair coupling factor (superfamily II helicase)
MLMIKNSFVSKNKTVFVVLPNLFEAQKYYDNLSTIVGEENVLFYPNDPTLTTLMALGSSDFLNERLYTIRALLTGKPYIVVTTHLGLKRRTLSVDDYKKSVKTLKTNDEISIKKLSYILQANGYERNYIVERPGEFSVRGNIVDIFTKENQFPYRLDFFGDEIEIIKIFDIDDQRSFDSVSEIDIMPLNEIFFTEEIKDAAIARINKYFDEYQLNDREKEKLFNDLENINERRNFSTLSIYTSFFNSKPTNILDFSNDKEIFVIDKHQMIIDEKNLKDDIKSFSMSLGNSKAYEEIPFYLSLEESLKIKYIEINNFGIDSNNEYESLNIKDLNYYANNYELFYIDNKEYFNNYTVIITIKNKDFFKKFKIFINEKGLLFNEDAIIENEINIISGEHLFNFLDHKNKILVISDSHLISHKIKPKIRYRSVLNESSKIRSVTELSPGDFVVHYEHGIAKYLGLVTMDLTGVKRDYLQLEYANNESMYIPVDQIDLILKYGSREGKKPKLSRLGGKTWANTKARVKKRIKDLSDKLLNLYAAREVSDAYEFNVHKTAEFEFSQDFIYEETKDQQRAIEETLSDMSSPKLMDRLVIGDVGFGKTEVALRAAFKAVLDGKQVAYLVPTTILARQHYYTFIDRFDKYGANVALLSRFQTQAEQKEIIKRLKSGLIDVVIGTHRILSQDIGFKDLGLFIIDEEQRFGVEHKERIKELKVNVDTLTLTATPIPRTLQMSLSGLKDMSMIETPPRNRYPIQTYVMPRNETIIKEAIEREIARGGQVFYLYNRVQSIPRIVQKLEKLVPEAKINFAHGKMNRHDIEDVLSDFISHEFNVLVATTIIETGIDIPNTNTIIIHDSDQLGLAQLYQVRGRVGRSDKIAYAYLMYDKNKILTDATKKRLNAIERYTELGSGFKVAIEDLTIRGAGDLLGSEQSGFIDSVGIEMYTELLREVITGKEKVITSNNEVYVSQHVAPEYINNDLVRIEIHKSISRINTFEDVENLKLELEDRFGEIDQELILYMYEKLYKKQAHRIGVEKTDVTPNQVEIKISKEKSKEIDGNKLFKLASHYHTPTSLSYLKEKVGIKFDMRNEKKHWLFVLNVFLSNYLK